MQLNSIYHKVIKAISYEVVYNRKPNYKRTSIGLRQIIIDEVKKQEIDAEIVTSLIRDGVTQEESTSKKVPVHCNCRDQKTWCSTRRCACVKAKAKCFITYHGGTNQDSTPNYSNISTMTMRTQRGYRTKDQVQAKVVKRQRRDKAGQWIASKGNNIMNNDKGSSRRRGRRNRK